MHTPLASLAPLSLGERGGDDNKNAPVQTRGRSLLALWLVGVLRCYAAAVVDPDAVADGNVVAGL